jgi:hypothetical protein
MPITTAVILLLAILLAPILLIRFRKRWVAAFNLAVKLASAASEVLLLIWEGQPRHACQAH